MKITGTISSRRRGWSRNGTAWPYVLLLVAIPLTAQPGSSRESGSAIMNPVPHLTRVYPGVAAQGQTIDLTFRGDGFKAGVSTVEMGVGVMINLQTVVSDSLMAANVTIAANAVPGTRDVHVVNAGPGGGIATIANGFAVTLLQNPIPTLAGISPASGKRGQSASLVFTGKGFIAGVTSVNLGVDITVQSTTVLSDVSMSAEISIGATAALGERDCFVVNMAPGGGVSGAVQFAVTDAVSGVETTPDEPPRTFSLFQNFPNPFNPSTTIRYGFPTREHVTLVVFNTLGQQVSILQNGDQDPGYHEVRFDGTNLPSGVYLYRLQSGKFTETKKLLLVR